MDDVQQVRSDLTRALVAWSVLSLGTGAVLALRHPPGQDDPRAGVARQMLAWGAVDLGIAGVGVLGSRGSRATVDPLREAASLRRLLLVNGALDVGYVALGAALVRAGRVRGRDSRGDGAAVVVQGAFLLVLDLVHAHRLRPGGTTPS